MGIDDKIDELYGLPLEEFTKARSELARELRSRGERESAQSVDALRKPTTAAWAVNQVMRTQRADARTLLDAGKRLRKAHEDVARGKANAGDLRDAAEAERVAVRRLSNAARGLVNASGRGVSESILERVTQTLHALSTDSEARAQASVGRLSKERRPSGAGLFAAAGAGASAARPRAASRRGPSEAQVRQARERLRRAQQEAREARAARTRAARATSRAEQALVRAREGMRAADKRAADKEAAAEELRRKLDELK
jgi:hypothetical protein